MGKTRCVEVRGINTEERIMMIQRKLPPSPRTAWISFGRDFKRATSSWESCHMGVRARSNEGSTFLTSSNF